MVSRRTTDRVSTSVAARFFSPSYALGVEQNPAAAVGRSGARAAGSLVEMHLFRRADGRLHARFRAYGDPATIAAADWVCEQVDGCERCVPPAVAECMRGLELPGRCKYAAHHAVAALQMACGRLE